MQEARAVILFAILASLVCGDVKAMARHDTSRLPAPAQGWVMKIAGALRRRVQIWRVGMGRVVGRFNRRRPSLPQQVLTFVETAFARHRFALPPPAAC